MVEGIPLGMERGHHDKDARQLSPRGHANVRRVRKLELCGIPENTVVPAAMKSQPPVQVYRSKGHATHNGSGNLGEAMERKLIICYCLNQSVVAVIRDRYVQPG
jgi:hypothetical protein